MSFFDRLNDLKRYQNIPAAQEEKLNLEKGDLVALVIAAFKVFLPILIVLGVITLAVMKFFRAI